MTQKRKKRVQHRCVKCGRVFPHTFNPFCECGGMIEVEYDLDHAHLYDSSNTLLRFFDLLPIENSESLRSQSMPCTPCVHARKLGALLEMPWLYLKDETKLPTGTTKDRMAAVSMAFLWECGVRAFCTSSTGNSSTAYAHAIVPYSDCRMYLFTAEDFQDRVDYGPSERVVPFVLRDASFVEAFNCAATFASSHKLFSERGFFNPGRRNGLKLAFLEATEQVPRPIDWYVQAVSSAMGVYGTFQGAKELLALGRIAQLPRLLCVQQESCAPMARAFLEGSAIIRPEHIVPRPSGIAQAILRGDPTRVYPYVRGIVLESDGTFAIVNEQEIREARRMVEELEGISPCYSASAALAGLVRQVRQGTLPRNATVLVNLTGSDRSFSQRLRKLHWLKAASDGWRPEDPTDHEAQTLWQEPTLS